MYFKRQKGKNGEGRGDGKREKANRRKKEVEGETKRMPSIIEEKKKFRS